MTDHPTPWRQGRKVPRNIYDANNEPIVMMPTDELAARVVEAVNHAWETTPEAIPGMREHDRLLQLTPRRSEDYTPWGQTERWADPAKAYPDCSGGCRFARWLESSLGADWCVCTNPASHRCGLLTFEHQGCEAFEPEERDDADE